ncbi:MAG: hypothetical protein PHW77_04700 [Eubacteriales bacterium]|nr:hypothetical protein [Eubacteriales bacterium]
MKKLAVWIVRKKATIIIVFAVAVIISAICIPFTEINYDDTVYLPDSSVTKTGLEVMQNEFGAGGSASAMLKDKSVEEILAVKQEISITAGVSAVLWLDDILLPLTENENTGLTDALKIEYI